MICKLFLEEGDYIDIKTGEPRNLVCADIVYSPEGQSDEWVGGFNTMDEVMEYFKIELKPISEEYIGLDPLEIFNLKQKNNNNI
jgi:hypothetical protein